MVPAPCARAVPVPPPAYHRAQAKVGPALHVEALTLVGCLHLLALCRLAVRLARRRCPPPLPPGPGGGPRPSREGSPALLRPLVRVVLPGPAGRAVARAPPRALRWAPP